MDLSPSAEPVGWGGAITALAVAAIPLLKAFGVNITDDQSSALLAFLAALIVVGTLLVRSRVTPTDKAQNLIDTAAAAPPGAPVPKL